MSAENMAISKEVPSVELADKTQEKVQALLKTSFEYLLAGVAEQNFKYYEFTSIDVFNKYNEISKPAVIAYPFFIALSNGHSEALYNLFGEFYTFTYGPASLSLIDILDTYYQEDKIELEYFSINSFDIKVKNSEEEKDFSTLKKRILKTNIPGYDTEFQNFKIQKDENGEYISYLYEAIDRGIKIIAERTDYLFDGSVKRVKDLAFYYESWAEKYQRNSTELIEYDQIGTSSKSRPIYAI